jgi:hypothetical protein
MTWLVVGYFPSGYKTICPIEFDTKEKAERIRDVSEIIGAQSCRYVVEEKKEQSRH